MKTVCLYFRIHQPMRLKRYRFFNMGKDTNYLDSYLNKTEIESLEECCYTPMNKLLLELIKEHGNKFKFSFAISGITIELLKEYSPKTIEGLKDLAETGCVEFLTETYSHSLASLIDKEEFQQQVIRHRQLIETEFGVKPTTFVNTELIYSDDIAGYVAQLGINNIVTEGAKHILGWKSPNYIYKSAAEPEINLLLRNIKLSDDIRYRFSSENITSEAFLGRISDLENNKGEIVNIFVDYETFGKHHNLDTGIFDFMHYFVDNGLNGKEIKFETPSEAVKELEPVDSLYVPHPISWADEERDVTAWLGNELQDEAFSKLYTQRTYLDDISCKELNHVWDFLQTSDNFGYMSTKWFSDNSSGITNPYGSPYEAFINYMNILSDFIRQVQQKKGV